jgi:hypothetical protein
VHISNISVILLVKKRSEMQVRRKKDDQYSFQNGDIKESNFDLCTRTHRNVTRSKMKMLLKARAGKNKAPSSLRIIRYCFGSSNEVCEANSATPSSSCATSVI